MTKCPSLRWLVHRNVSIFVFLIFFISIKKGETRSVFEARMDKKSTNLLTLPNSQGGGAFVKILIGILISFSGFR